MNNNWASSRRRRKYLAIRLVKIRRNDSHPVSGRGARDAGTLSYIGECSVTIVPI